MENNFSLPQGNLIDLTHNYSKDTIYWPTEEGFNLNSEFEGMTEKGYYYSAKKFSAPEHGGTHMDAPIHFAKDGKTIEQIPLENLIGPAIVIDVSESAIQDPDYQISIEDFTNWESVHGQIPNNVIVLL